MVGVIEKLEIELHSNNILILIYCNCIYITVLKIKQQFLITRRFIV